LLVASLTLIDRATRLYAITAGDEIPKAVLAAIDLMFGVAAFLVIWLQLEQSDEE
jgi:hypothetical protein